MSKTGVFGHNFKQGTTIEDNAKPGNSTEPSKTGDESSTSTHILILKSETRALIQAETYLRNRKFIVGSVTSIKESLAYVVQKKPHIILISADIPNKKIKVLPKMLAQAFTIRCVGFCENNAGTSVRNLTDLRLEYVLYPPVSGPAIERLILKIKKDDEIKAHAGASNSQAAYTHGESKSGNIEIKGAPKAPMTAEALNNLLNSTEDSGHTDAGGNHIHGSEKASGGMAYSGNLGKDSSSAPGGPGYVPGQGNNPGASGYAPGDAGSTSRSQSNQQQTAQRADESFEQWAERMRKEAQGSGSVVQKGSGAGDALAARGGTDSTNLGNTNQEGSGPGDALKAGGGSSGLGPGSNDHGGGPSEKKDGYTLESEYQPKKKRKAYRFETDSKQDLSAEKLIIRGTQSSLDKTVVKKDDLDADSVTQIEKASNIACITIDSPKFSGYLICALGKNRSIDQSFVSEVQKKLVKFLVDNGEPAKERDTLNMKIQEVDFTDWALEEAEFLRTSVHNGDEIAMAFFPTNDLEVKLEDSASEKMVKLSIDDLKEDAVVEFDLYLFMPGNNKYLLYTPQGMPFYGDQKNRLKEKGVQHIHLRKENAMSVKKYKAQNFLNEKIQSYKAAKQQREA